MSTVELRLGDMFDGPSDLIVLPCSTSGSITEFVHHRLIHYSIPYPKGDMNLGDVQVLPFEGGENIAQFVAYAVSVGRRRTSEEAIYRIGFQLGEQTTRVESIRHIAAPLLGTGGGHLPAGVAASRLRDGFRSSCHRDSSLVVSILDEDIFEEVRKTLAVLLSQEQGTTGAPLSDERRLSEKPPRVFISYSHTSHEHEQWVWALASFLRRNGVDARLDEWHLRHGMDLPQFMTNELTLADRVVVVSDEKYAQKADGRAGGVGWETMIIQGDIAQLPPESTKYLIVVRSPTLDAGLPHYLRTKYVIHWPKTSVDDKNRDLLIQDIFNDLPVPDEIGPRPRRLYA
jgi:hypothetical protein